MTETLKTVVSVLPKHARLGLITYDDAVQCHVLAAEGDTLHKLLVATDVGDPFCPHNPEALVPPVGERQEAWELLLELLPTLYPEPPVGTHVHTKSHAFGAAIHFAYEVLRELGGKVIAFTCGRPTAGKGLLMPRDDRSSLGTSEEPKRCGAQNCTYVKRVEPRIAVDPTHRCGHVVPAVKNQSHTPISQR
eukprot:COSAG03_NODE_3714_length_1864_cov_1.098017_2_plen_191_part_00